MIDPRIEIVSEMGTQSCQSCEARNYEAFTKPVDVDQLFEIIIGNSHTVLCPGCLELLGLVIGNTI